MTDLKSDNSAAASWTASPRAPRADVPAGAPARLRVLVSAYAVSPARGSEPGMGWNICSRLARYHDVTVLCSPVVPPDVQNFRGEIEQHLREHGPVPGLSFRFVEPPFASYWLQRESKVLRRTLYYVGYRSWQRAAYRAARELIDAEPFDLVHQLNITGYREPGYLWRLPAPFVWGPVGGAANVPAPFMPMMGLSERLFYTARNVTNDLQQRAMKRCRRAAKAARHVWVIGEANRRLVEDVWGSPAEPMLEVGAEPQPAARVRAYDGSRPLNLVWSGLHVGRKALPLLLQALRMLADADDRRTPGVRVTVLGDGSETGAWTRLAAELGVADALRWTGRLPRADALREMASADAFVSTSVLEETSLVVLESLSLGLPVLCHDAYGMGAVVNASCGIKVPMTDPQSSAAGFAAAIRRLCESPADVARLSAGALARATELSWGRKAQQIAQTYSRLVPRPSCARRATA